LSAVFGSGHTNCPSPEGDPDT